MCDTLRAVAHWLSLRPTQAELDWISTLKRTGKAETRAGAVHLLLARGAEALDLLDTPLRPAAVTKDGVLRLGDLLGVEQ